LEKNVRSRNWNDSFERKLPNLSNGFFLIRNFRNFILSQLYVDEYYIVIKNENARKLNIHLLLGQ